MSSAATPTDTEAPRKSVTIDEYKDGFSNFVLCMQERGHDIPFEWDEYMYSVRIPEAAVTDGSFQDCYYSTFQAVDVAWQLANEYHSAAQVRIRECLTELGVAPLDTVEGVQQQIEESRLDVDRCLSQR